ncbi:DNA methyltransferase [Actinomadura sp. BRA 177]|uniref:Eco57I restriction-modification methylase domain-containing protein n=1 Tax=Actinomadura sp. BRA 177 TaxID=2745202 RepID=UPI00281508E7|nr:DNA methyltransferase [Actinomadura sp. BRA 177]
MVNKRWPRHRDDFNHADWLSLIDVSGPFLSVPVLRRVWPTLDALDKGARERLRQEHAALPGRPWIDYVLTELLGWGDAAHFTGLDALSMDVPEHDTAVTPSFALLEPGTAPGEDAKNVRLLGLVSDDRPTQRIKDSDWAATPVDRLAQLCRHHDVQLGLATDGRWWALVWAPRGGVTTTAVFDAVNWHEAAERDVVRAFVSILSRARFFAVPDDETLVRLLDVSKDNQEDITEALGVQVRQAVELLVAAIGRAHTADVAQGGRGLTDVSAHEVYRGAVAVMMRVVFLLFAEERGLLPADKELYRTAYSAGLLCAELEQRALDGTEEDLEHTYTGWHRLLALFNAVYFGVDHPEMKMHAHDGSIFNPETYAWLPHTIDDRTVLHMLQAVQYVEIGTGKSRERRRLSFAALDVEQIGYVYEGLLSFEGFHADETYVGLIGKAGFEEEVPLRTLEEFAAACPDVPSLAAKMATEYKDSRIGSAKALEKHLAPLPDAEKQDAQRKLLAVTAGDYPLTERLLPFYKLIRTDLRDLPVVILTDALYVTESSLRKNTGTHYTPSFLAKQVVEGALEPLVYSPGPLQTADKNEWKLKTSDEILSLKVADIAMGSAAFLVAACRYLGDKLVEAWVREGDERVRDYKGKSTTMAADAEADPVTIDASRQIIEHCLYGADINEMAVEMAKLSLWLVSMDPHKPFTFLDDRLIVGDSLLGITSLDQLEVMHMDAKRGRQIHERLDVRLTAGVRELVSRVADERRRLVEMDGSTIEGLDAKRAILAETLVQTKLASFIGDMTVGAALANAGRGDAGLRNASVRVADLAMRILNGDERAELQARDQLREWLGIDLPAGAFSRQPIHWPLVFPEVFENDGFDAIIGNPPFLGGSKITGSMGTAYREHLVRAVGYSKRGTADLVAYFVLRAHSLINNHGQTGLIATNTLPQGDTREVGLDQVIELGSVIRRAIKSRPWPSKSAMLEYCVIWTSWTVPTGEAEYVLNDLVVKAIEPGLTPASRVTGNPHRLDNSQGIAFIGVKLIGNGFAVDPDVAELLIEKNSRNADVLHRYLIGRDLNSRADLTASRYVINFREWNKERAMEYEEVFDIVERDVKPFRQRKKPDGSWVLTEPVREKYWQFEATRPAMLEAIGSLDSVIAMAQVSSTVMPVVVSSRQVFDQKVVVFASSDKALLVLLSSGIHYWWTVFRSGTMKTDLSYSPTDVLQTLPFPEMTSEMRRVGQRLDGFRRDVMLGRQAGLTKTYNMVHDPGCSDADIVELREIHRAIDEAVCRAYGWDDLIPELDHGHHAAGRETRYTVGPAVQRELIDRLLELNHERYDAEKAAGLHDKKGKKRPKASEQDGLF